MLHKIYTDLVKGSYVCDARARVHTYDEITGSPYEVIPIQRNQTGNGAPQGKEFGWPKPH